MPTYVWVARITFFSLYLGAVGADAMALGANAKGFQQKLSLHGITFVVSSPNKGSVNTLRVMPSGKISSKKPIVTKVDGTVTGAEIADLNGDGWPELVVFVTSAGSGSYGSLVGFSVSRGKSITGFILPDLIKDTQASQGYRGHDEFAIVENTLVRRFPVYLDGDTNAQPTGGSRQLRYQLVPGDATRLLKVLRE